MSAEVEHFIDEVAHELGCETAEAEKLAVAVVATLEERLPVDEVQDLEAELPQRVRELVAQLDRVLDLPGMDASVFYARVAQRSKMTHEDAERTVAAVMKALRAHLSPREARRIATLAPA